MIKCNDTLQYLISYSILFAVFIHRPPPPVQCCVSNVIRSLAVQIEI